ncbi:MAG TPA: S8 family serine peptidase [Xanthobacteraceae bacterium]|jgi:hypothetical protein
MNRKMIRAAAAALWLLATAIGGAQGQLRGLGGGNLGGGIGGLGGSGLPSSGGFGASALPGGSSFPGVSTSPSSSVIPSPSSVPDLLAPGGSVLDRGLPLPNAGALPTTGNVIDGLYGQTRNTLDTTLGAVNGALGTGRAGAATLPNATRTSRIPPRGERRFVANEVVIGLRSNASQQTLDSLMRRHRLTPLESWDLALTGTRFLRLQIADRRSVTDVVRELEADNGIGFAQPNYRFTLQQSQPTNRLQDDQYSLTKLHIFEAHGLSTGATVPIAIIDNGIDDRHPELTGTIAARFDASERPQPPAPHGTAMAGAIVAHAQLMGVAPNARILAVRAFSATGESEEATTITIVRGIDWAIAHGARVINMSFAGPRDPEIASALAAAAKRGVVLVAAAGNAGPKSAPLYPAADPNVIAVTATDADDNLFVHSNRGRYIAVAAPGVDVLVPAPRGVYQFTTGTSVAAALVSGIAALLIELEPRLSPQALKRVLLATAKDLGPKGRDDQFGAGLVDAYRAAQAVSASAERSSPPTAVSIAR